MKNVVKMIWIFAMLAMGLSCKKSDDSGINETPEPYTTPETPVEWVLDFEDNFDGTALDTNSWAIYDNSWSDNPEHMRRIEAVQVKDGFLNLLVDVHPTDPARYMTGGVAHLKNYTYGKFEFRVRMDNDPASATGGVCLTWPESDTWPKDGENDIYETEYESNHWNTWIHYGKLGSDNQWHDTKYQKTHTIDKTQWNIVAMEWSPEYIKIYINGKLSWTLKDPEAIAKVPHHICFQTEKDLQKDLVKPIQMQVDWVKVYKRVPKE